MSMSVSVSVSVRAMDLADYEAVAELWRRTEGIGLNESDSHASTEAYLRRNPDMSAVAVFKNKIVGAVLCGHDGRRGYLHHLAVAQSHRGQGVAKRLLRHCFERLAAERIPKCNIFLFHDNDAGAAFWVHNGWAARRDLRVLQKNVLS
jgi:putative acetyltransferase